jgi:hypothetical protein
MQFVDEGASSASLQTACVTYKNEAGISVRLVSAVHIGEKEYFQALNKSFEQDDAVLYEMVKPKDAPAPEKGQQSNSAVSQFQRLLKDTLNLEFQLDVIDYTKANFVHADLDAETFTRMQQERGETFEMLMLKGLMKALSSPPAPEAAPGEADAGGDAGKMADELIAMLTRPDGERRLKLMVARHMGEIDEKAMGLDGPNGSVIVTERNKAAIEVLKKTMAAGKKKISIFYGAAHMPDMARRLEEMGFKAVRTDWQMAWDLAIRGDQPSMAEKMLRDLFEEAGRD